MLGSSIKYIMVAGAVVLVLLMGWFAVQSSVHEEGLQEGETASITSPVASTTEPLGEVPVPTQAPEKKTLPPEPTFVLPESAVSLDEYSYENKGLVYFISLVDAGSPLEVTSADPKTFRRLQGFSTYPGSDVVRDCGAAPIYTYYVDKHRPYFYQIWRAPEFRTTQIDALNEADAKNFSVTGLTAATDGTTRFDVVYTMATSTCLLILEQTPL